jgi:probable F420-dependent oxidoreductase
MSDLGRVGIWSGQLRRSDPGEVSEAAAELDELGFGTLWIPGGMGGDLFADCERLLTATKRAVVATGILNIWMHEPAETARGHAALTSGYPGRFLLGLGVSHAIAVDAANQTYEKPLSKMVAYLDALDAAAPPVPVAERVLAALGPRMLQLSRDRTAGAHPYFSSPEHTAVARDVLGPGPLLAPEQMVVLETDPDAARAIARRHVRRYLQLPNYTNNLLRHGLDANDIAGEGSNRLVDAVVAWGDVDAVAGRIKEHHEAGADHVCIQVLRDDPAVLPRQEWRQLASLVKS